MSKKDHDQTDEFLAETKRLNDLVVQLEELIVDHADTCNEPFRYILEIEHPRFEPEPNFPKANFFAWLHEAKVHTAEIFFARGKWHLRYVGNAFFSGEEDGRKFSDTSLEIRMLFVQKADDLLHGYQDHVRLTNQMRKLRERARPETLQIGQRALDKWRCYAKSATKAKDKT